MYHSTEPIKLRLRSNKNLTTQSNISEPHKSKRVSFSFQPKTPTSIKVPPKETKNKKMKKIDNSLKIKLGYIIKTSNLMPSPHRGLSKTGTNTVPTESVLFTTLR